MAADNRSSDRANSLRAIDTDLLDRPLDFIVEDHNRIRDMCRLIDYVIDRPGTHQEIVAQVSDFVRVELPVLIDDEGEDLLPLVQRRCEPEDEIDRLRSRLDAEHDTAMYLLPDALETLDALGRDHAGVSGAGLSLLRNFAAHLHLHLAFENAILIPLARARLTEQDLTTLRIRMIARRGLDRPRGDTDAT